MTMDRRRKGGYQGSKLWQRLYTLPVYSIASMEEIDRVLRTSYICSFVMLFLCSEPAVYGQQHIYGIWQRDFFLCLLINGISSKLLYRYVTYLFFYCMKELRFYVIIIRSIFVAAQQYLNIWTLFEFASFNISCGECESHSAWLCYRRVFRHNSLLLIGHCTRSLIPIGWINVQIFRRHILPLTNDQSYAVWD